MSNDSALKVGDRFPDPSSVQDAVNSYGDSINTQFYKRDSKTIAAALKKKIQRPIDPKLQYYQLLYCCIKGGKNFASSSTGERSSR